MSNLTTRARLYLQRAAWADGYEAGAQDNAQHIHDTGISLSERAAAQFPWPKREVPRLLCKDTSAGRITFALIGGRLKYAMHLTVTVGDTPPHDYLEVMHECLALPEPARSRCIVFTHTAYFLTAYAELEKQPTEWVESDE